MNTKVCTKCEEEKDLSEFYKNRTKKLGVNSSCKICDDVQKNEWKNTNREEYLKSNKNYYEKNKDSIRSSFRKKYKLIKDEKNKNRREDYFIKVLSKKPPKQRKTEEDKYQYKHNWYESNKERIILERKAYYNKNKRSIIDGNRERSITRHAVKWANITEIKQIYKEAKSLSQKTNITYEVDHIIPVRGKRVCGLHVETNLRVIPKEDNRKKGNKFCIS